eukprot:COSAG06_NODE_1224_length_10198_cov_15.139816_3_plen_60_part_00
MNEISISGQRKHRGFGHAFSLVHYNWPRITWCIVIGSLFRSIAHHAPIITQGSSCLMST